MLRRSRFLDAFRSRLDKRHNTVQYNMSCHVLHLHYFSIHRGAIAVVELLYDI